MPKAEKNASTPGPELGPVMARMREIAAQSGDTLLLANGPPHADFELLDLCADADDAA